ncbi:MAG: class A beta-lactamase-related serine hydrolase [Gammaproteobacteria bacterium]|nr:class A beta-lactamase-related serine hydrolase [Gammaproteobacteria bacterium]
MDILKTGLLLLLCAIALSASAEDAWQPLYNRVDAQFQAALEERLNANPEWKKLIRNKKMAIGVVDMSGEVPRFARVNGNQMMYAASLPKIAILLAAYVSFEDGSLQETDEIMTDLQDMIQVSSNSAATRMIDRIGMQKIQSVLRDPQYGFYDEKRGGGLWVGKRYASTGPRSGDPLFNISHGATATQVCRFFYLLATHRLINEHRSDQMLADLVNPHLHHKFVSQLDELAPKATLFRKSGTWRQWHSDAIMVQGVKWRNYILVGLIESEHGEQILRSVLPAVEELMVPPEYSEGGHDIDGDVTIP